jgi:hypothetical protein
MDMLQILMPKLEGKGKKILHSLQAIDKNWTKQ